jgi:hypothetical protein
MQIGHMIALLGVKIQISAASLVYEIVATSMTAFVTRVPRHATSALGDMRAAQEAWRIGQEEGVQHELPSLPFHEVRVSPGAACLFECARLHSPLALPN